MLNLSFHVNVLQGFVGCFHRKSDKLVEEFDKLVKTEGNIINVVPLLYVHGMEAVKGN